MTGFDETVPPDDDPRDDDTAQDDTAHDPRGRGGAQLDADEGEPDIEPFGGDDDIASGHPAG